MDPLTQLLDLLRPRTFLWKQLVGRGDWEWHFPAVDGVVFGRVVSGRCWFDVPGTGEQEAATGDFLLLTSPEPWILRGGRGGNPVDFDVAWASMVAAPEGASDDPDVTRMTAGHFEFDAVNASMLISLLSPVVHIRADQRGDHEPLSGVLKMIDAEASSNRPGRESVLSRLLEITLIELLRSPELLTARRGMLLGLADPPIAGALHAFHADIKSPWSVATLAQEATMSRSVFSGRFTALVGEPPMTYVRNWRMAVARDALVSGQSSVDQVAAAVGYSSASAFSTAFTRTVGSSPAKYARATLPVVAS